VDYSDVVLSDLQYGLRLIDGESESRGRLEVQISGVWGTICDNLWDFTDADIACKQLGFSGALFPDASPSIPGVGLPIFFENVNCSGNEVFI